MGDQYSTSILWNLQKAIGHHYVDEIKYEYIHNRKMYKNFPTFVIITIYG